MGSTLWHIRWAGLTVVISSRTLSPRITRPCHLQRLQHHIVEVRLWIGVRHVIAYIFQALLIANLLFVVIRSTLVWVGDGMGRKKSQSQPQGVLSPQSLWSRLSKQRHHILQVRDRRPRFHFPLYRRRSRCFYSACSTRQPTPT